MTTTSTSDGLPRPDGEPAGGAPFLPPAPPTVPAPPVPAPSLPPSIPAAEQAPAGAPAPAPFLPSARPPEPAAPAPASQPAFDAKAMVESQKHYNANPAYGALPEGTEESRAAARKLREQANRKRRRNKTLGRVFAVIVVVGLAVGGYFAYQAIQDDPPPADSSAEPRGDDASPAGGGGALTPLGEQEQVVEVLGDLNAGATPSAGGLLDAVDQARDVVGQAQPPVAGAPTLMVAEVFSPAVLDHTDVLDPADGYERFVVRTADLVAIDPGSYDALVTRLIGLPQVAADDAALAVAPVVLPGDVAIAIQRDGDTITRIVAVASDPEIRAVGP